MPKILIFVCTLLCCISSFSQVVGGRNNSEMTPQVSKPSELSSGVYSGDVNLFSGDYNSSIKLGAVATPSGLSYELSLNYSSSFSIGNTMPISTGIPYGEGWNLNIPTISIETEVFNNFTKSQNCGEAGIIEQPLNFNSLGNNALKEGDLYWFSPYINVPGVVSGRAVFKYVDVNDDKTVVFELNAFESHAEIRYSGDKWVVIAADGTRYTFQTAVQSYNAPANKRVLYYNQANLATGTNNARAVQHFGEYQNPGQAAMVENSILPKQKYNLWYCDAITHRNQPFQGINFTYKGFGKFNYFKEYEQEAYKYAATEKFLSSTFAKEHDFSCYSDLLLLKVEAISIDGLVDRLELNYATDRNLILSNTNELIDYTSGGNGRVDSLYSYQPVYTVGKADGMFGPGWKRYEHSKKNNTMNPASVNSSDPYATTNGYLRYEVSSLSTEIPFSHSFLESPRLMQDKLYPGDIYEVRSRIKRSNSMSVDFLQTAGTFDMSIVTGDLENERGLNAANYDLYNGNNGIYYATTNYLSTRSKVLYSTFNMALKWSLNYGEGDKTLSNLFVMPNIPTKYKGFNFQIGPGNSDVNYAVERALVKNDSIPTKLEAGKAYVFHSLASSYPLKSAADIAGNFGIGLPWNLVSPVYEYMITHQNTFNYATADAKEAYNFWWNDNGNVIPNDPSTLNVPTKLDSTVRLDEFELIRYSKNPYMLVGVKYYKVNGDVGGPVETGLHLVAQKKLEYTSATCKMLQNYAYQPGDSLQYRTDVWQVFVLLKAVREVPLGWTSDTTKLLTTFLSYSKFTNNAVAYQTDQPMNGHFGMVLTQIVDYLGGITKIEYYPANDARTRYTGSFLLDRSGFCGITTSPGYGTNQADVVHPIVKYVLKNDEDDLVKNNTSSANNGHKRWRYDFDASSKISKLTTIQIADAHFYNGRRFNFDTGFKKVSVYGPSLVEGSNEYVNRTDYEHYGADFNYGGTFPSTEDYLYHGKLKSVKEYDVNNKIFTEKLINYAYTLAYKNGYTRPNPYREDLVWEQEYDNPGLEYEYRDYYLNQVLTYNAGPGIGVVTGTSAYPYLDVPAFKGTGLDFELPKFLEFDFYPGLETANPEYMFHSYFIKKTEEIDRKYDDYLSKQAIYTGGTAPGPFSPVANPFGSGFVNPVGYNNPLFLAQKTLINTKPAAVVLDSLMIQSPLMDSTLYFMLNSTILRNEDQIAVLLRQGNLSNMILSHFISKFGPSPFGMIGFSPISVIQQQSYISDEVLSTVLPKITRRWDLELIETLFLKNEYLSDPVLQQLTGTGISYFNTASFTRILSKQPQFSEAVIDKIAQSKYLVPADLSKILKNQVISEANYSTIIANAAILNNTIVEIIESGSKYPTEGVFGKLMTRTPAFTEAEMERIIEVTDREIEPAVLTALITIYGAKPFLTGFTFKGNPLDVYCNNSTQSGWNYIETKTTYEYYEADYKGTSNGNAYKTLMSLEDIPGRIVSFNGGANKTISSLRLKHEPSWQVFKVTNTSTHLPTAKDEKQFFYLFDLKNRYDRYWYNYDIQEVNGETTPFDFILLNNDLDTIGYTVRWDSEYVDAYLGTYTPELPKYDGMTKSRQYAMRTTPFQQMHVTKNQRDAKELRKSEYYFYDSRLRIDPYSTNQTVLYDGPSCPSTGTPPVNPVSCASCVRWKYGTEADFLSQLPFNYCLWKDPVIGYFACPSSVNYAACNNGVTLVDCNPAIPEEDEEGGPAGMIILTDALKKSLQLRSVVTQIDTVQGIPSRDFNNLRFDRKNTLIADFYMQYDGVDDQNFIRPFKMLYPFDTLVTTHVHKRNQHLQPALISNSVGLMTKFYYNGTVNRWNVDTNCTNPAYSFNYNYSSVDMRNIGLPIRVTVGYLRPDSLTTTFDYTNDGQVKRMITSSGHTMEYTFDGFNRLSTVKENGTRLISRNEYQLWKHGSGKSFEERTRENYVYSVLYQHETDTLNNREFQKAFLDPLGRTAGVVRAYRGEGNVQISSGSIDYDNWGRAKTQRKPSLFVDPNQITGLNPISYNYNSGSTLYHETKFDHDPASLDARVSDPGISISDPQNHVIRKQTWIVNNIYMSCELGLSGAELKLIMNAGATGAFRFLRTSVKDQDGKETITYTNAFGQTVATLSWSSVIEKVVTLYVYDSYGNLSKTINARRQNTDYQYNLSGQLIRETNVDGGEKRYIYNKHGKISGVQDQADREYLTDTGLPASRFRKFTYDVYGNLLSQALVTTSYHIDPFCFQNKIVGSESSYYYDSQSLPHYFSYVFSNRMTQDWLNNYSTIDPVNGQPMVTSGLPAAAPVASLVLEKSMVYGTQQSSPSTLGKLTESYSYGLTGLAIQKITYTYNTEDLLASQVIVQHPVSLNFNDQYRVKATIYYPKYNLRGSLLEEKLDMGSDGSTDMKYFYVYDALNRLKEVYTSQADVVLTSATKLVDYKYDDARGVVISKGYSVDDFTDGNFGHQTVSYAYDNRDRLTLMGSDLFNEWLYYDNTQLPVYNNQTSVSQADVYNGNVKGTKVKYNFSGTTNSSIPLFSKETIYGYQYDGLNRLVSADALVGDFIDAHFAISPNLSAAQSYLIGDESYSYDKIGNLVTLLRRKPGATPSSTVVVEDFVYTYLNGNNRLKQVSDLTTTTARNYSYDANGNLLTDSHRGISATVYGRSSYAYNITKGTDQISYLYDGGDQRMFKKVVTSAQTTQEMYVKDALGRDLAIVRFTGTGSSVSQTEEFYVYGNERAAMIVPNTLGTTPSRIQYNEATFFLADHLGNTRVAYMATTTPGSSYIINALDYYPYGKVLREYDNGAGDKYLTTQHERDQETGLDYRGARYYDSDVARFLSLDPKASKYPNISAYCYVAGMPTVAVDPDGKDIVFAVSKNSDGTIAINMTVNAKVVNESQQNFSQEQLKAFSERISQGLINSYSQSGFMEIKDDNGNLISGNYTVNVSVNISVASEENPIASTDHVFRIQDPKQMPGAGSNIAVWGFAEDGQNYVYVSTSILENKPATEGSYAGTGKTSDGKPTLERTSAHELGHSGGLVYGNYGHNNPWSGNLMTPDTQAHSGIKLVSSQILKLINSYRNDETNKGDQKFNN